MLLRQGSSAFNKIVAQQDQQADCKMGDIAMQLVNVAWVCCLYCCVLRPLLTSATWSGVLWQLSNRMPSNNLKLIQYLAYRLNLWNKICQPVLIPLSFPFLFLFKFPLPQIFPLLIFLSILNSILLFYPIFHFLSTPSLILTAVFTPISNDTTTHLTHADGYITLIDLIFNLVIRVFILNIIYPCENFIFTFVSPSLKFTIFHPFIVYPFFSFPFPSSYKTCSHSSFLCTS